MARALRIDFPGAWHHVMNKGVRGEHLFRCDEDRMDFEGLLAGMHKRYQIEVHAFCMMGTHYHLLLRTPLGNLSQGLRHVDGVFAQRFNRRHGRDGSVYKDRFRSKLVDTDGYLDRVVRYIHRNPLEAGIVANLADYPWSSYPEFLRHPALRPTWLYDTAVRWSGIRSGADLRAFTEGRDAALDLDVATFPLAIGSNEFIAAAVANAVGTAANIGQLRAAPVRPDVGTIESVVADAFGCSVQALRQAPRGLPMNARLIAIGLLQEVGGLTLDAIASRYGYATGQSAGVATSRFRAISDEPEWAIKIETIRASIEGAVIDGRCRVSKRIGS